MAVTHWIGPFPFVTLEGEVAVPKRRVDVLTRQGVDGVGVFVHGRVGQPFVLRSFADCADLGAARFLADNYPALIGAGVVILVWNAMVYPVHVLAVDEVAVRALGGGVGFLVADPAAAVSCDWTLVTVDL